MFEMEDAGLDLCVVWVDVGVIVAAFTDWLDGYIAKNYNQTVSGSSIKEPTRTDTGCFSHAFA